MEQTNKNYNKQLALNIILTTISKYVQIINQHKGAVHELNIVVELSQVYERIKEHDDEVLDIDLDKLKSQTHNKGEI